MGKKLFTRLSLALVIIVALLVFTSSIFAQGRSSQAFERVRAVKERNVARFMSLQGVEGVAIGLGQNNSLTIMVMVENSNVRAIPQGIEGFPVQRLVTGKIYAVKPSQNKKASQSVKPPTNLSAAVEGSSVLLSWRASKTPSVESYNIYCSYNTPDSYSWIDNVSGTTYTDTSLADGTYYYYVTALNGTTESAPSTVVTAAVGSEPVPPEPADPTDWFGRPVPIGVSTGNANEISAGTIGCRVTDGKSVYALSNNHVYAMENQAQYKPTNIILQPGRYDLPNYIVTPDDYIGSLANFWPINFSGDNTIDAAIALVSTDTVGTSTPSDGYGTPKSTTKQAGLLMTVQKYGRTTALTKGTVIGIDATISVGYSSGTAHFSDQIVVYGGRSAFIKAGDSGSLLVTDTGDPDTTNVPVGLLFAGDRSGKYAFANPIDDVLAAFDVTIDGE